MNPAPPRANFRIEDPHAVRLADDSAILSYRATAHRTGQEPYAAHATTVFVEHDGSWRPVFHQPTPMNAA